MNITITELIPPVIRLSEPVEENMTFLRDASLSRDLVSNGCDGRVNALKLRIFSFCRLAPIHSREIKRLIIMNYEPVGHSRRFFNALFFNLVSLTTCAATLISTYDESNSHPTLVEQAERLSVRAGRTGVISLQESLCQPLKDVIHEIKLQLAVA